MDSYCITQYGEPLVFQQSLTPIPKEAEVLIEVSGCGVCHSDVHIWEGHFNLGEGRKIDLSRIHELPFILGHEIVGCVVNLGETAKGVSVGDQVVVFPWIGCGICDMCMTGMENLCRAPKNLGVNLNGGFSTHVIVPNSKYLFLIGEQPSELAATYACSGLTKKLVIERIEISS